MDTTSALRQTQAARELRRDLASWRMELLVPILCSLALVVTIVLANPFVDSAFNDDWAYSDTALKLAQTGKIHYNGWGSPTILFQSAWAALFIHLFGFSFQLLRAISLPFSIGSVWLTYFLGRQLGLRCAFAGFAALTMAVSPLFIPLSASFMTEPYACFFTFLCLYAALACADSKGKSSVIRWLWILAGSGILGGSNRQTVWLLPLLLLPYLIWLKRTERWFLAQTAAAYSVCLASMTFIVLHFRTGYAVSDMSRNQWLLVVYTNFSQGAHYVMSLLLVTALMALPALLCAVVSYRKLGVRNNLAIGALCVIAFDYLRSGFGSVLGLAPFLGNILTARGILDEFTGLGTRPQIWHLLESYSITFLLLFTLALWSYLVKSGLAPFRLRSTARQILLIFGLSYICLLVPGALLTFCYDRYALLLLPLATICALLPFQGLLDRVPVLSWVTLAAFALFGTATTHDYFRYLQARAAAVKLSEKKGINRMQIAAGVESDGWLQTQNSETIEHVAHNHRPGSYNYLWFTSFVSAIQPNYVTYASTISQVPRTAIVTVRFFNWLPPSYQAVSVVKSTDIPMPSN